MKSERMPKHISRSELAALGLPTMVYVKPVTKDGVNLFQVHAANGQAIGLTDSFESAVAAALQRDLHPVSIH